MKNFHNLKFDGILGLGWASGSKLNGEEMRISKECQMLKPDGNLFASSLSSPKDIQNVARWRAVMTGQPIDFKY